MAVKKVETNSSNGHGGGRVKFRYADAERYVDLDMENASAAVADGIKSLASALSGRTILAPARELAGPKIAAATVPTTVNQEEIQFPPQGEQVEQDYAEEAGTEEASNGNGSGQKRAYNFKAPKFMDDLDLTKTKKPLAEYVSDKGNPTEMLDKYLVVAVWLKEHMGVDEFTIHHIYTCFDNLSWKAQMPVDHSQPLRDLKTKKHFLTKEKGTGYKVNWQGIQYVANLGAAKA